MKSASKKAKTSEFYVQLGRLVKAKREQETLTQDALAKQTNLSRVSIANIEAGKQSILFEHIIEISRALKVEITQIISIYENTLIDREILDEPSDVSRELRMALSKSGK